MPNDTKAVSDVGARCERPRSVSDPVSLRVDRTALSWVGEICARNAASKWPLISDVLRGSAVIERSHCSWVPTGVLGTVTGVAAAAPGDPASVVSATAAKPRERTDATTTDRRLHLRRRPDRSVAAIMCVSARPIGSVLSGTTRLSTLSQSAGCSGCQTRASR